MSEQKSLVSKKVTILLIVIGLLVSALLVYVFFVRVQDSDYDTASSSIETMITKVAEFEQMAEDGDLNTQTLDAAQLAAAKQTVADYNDALNAFRNSRAYKFDANVSAAYEKNSKLIEEYGKSSADMVTTVVAVASIQQSCDAIINNSRLVKSLDELHEQDDNCLGALDEYESVPIPQFDKDYYQVLHKQVRTILTALEVYYTSKDDDQQQKALNSYVIALYAIETLNNDKKNVISNSANPTDGLKEIQDLLNQRRGVLLR